MAYFPFFVDLEGKHGIIVGGGSVALRKAEQLLAYGALLTVVAPEIRPELWELPGITVVRGPFDAELLRGADFVIAATDDDEMNRHVSCLCGERRIPVNVVDNRELCSFLFPALLKRGSLSVGISTGGASPTAAVYLKKQIGELLPPGLEDILAYLGGVRDEVRAVVPGEENRSLLYSHLFTACMEKGGPLSREEFRSLLEETSCQTPTISDGTEKNEGG